MAWKAFLIFATTKLKQQPVTQGGLIGGLFFVLPFMLHTAVFSRCIGVDFLPFRACHFNTRIAVCNLR